MDERELEDLDKHMKKELQNWLAYVTMQRNKFYVLNYFTCLQLLKISEEFFQMINYPDYEINKEILLLLMSISSELKIEDVKKVMSSTEAQEIALKSLNAPPTSSQDESYFVSRGDIDAEVEKLSEEAREIFNNAVAMNYSKRLVLEALRHNGCEDEDNVIEWCMDNDKAYAATALPVGDPEEPKIDASHKIVKELVDDLRYPVGLAIEAVKECGEELDDCIGYCASKDLAKSVSECTNDACSEDLHAVHASDGSIDSPSLQR